MTLVKSCSESPFRFLRNLINVKNYIGKLYAEKFETFWKDEIFKLRERWGKVEEQNGTYIIQ